MLLRANKWKHLFKGNGSRNMELLLFKYLVTWISLPLARRDKDHIMLTKRISEDIIILSIYTLNMEAVDF